MRAHFLLLCMAIAGCASQGPPAAACGDSVKNGDESDVDCGGACAPCATLKTCGAAADCQSAVCTAGRCADPAPSCTDGKKNAGESDVDCGSGCVACVDGKACAAAADCQSGACDGGRCVPAPVIGTITPDRGPTTGGTAITVAGDHFRAGATVTVGAAMATVTSVSDKQLVFTLPASLGKPGARDVVVTLPGGGAATRKDALRYYLGNISMAGKVDYATGSEPRGLRLADLNGDGNLDVITSHRSAGTVGVNLGKGDGAFQPIATYDNGGLGSTLAVGDYNSDMKLDLATVSVTAGGAAVLTGKGDGTFNARQVTAVTDLLRLTGGDLNGDGRPDLILGLRNTNKGVRAMLGVGDGTFNMTALTATAEQVITVGTADLNKDGKLDVIASQTGSLLVLFGNGNGTLQNAATYPVGSSAAVPQAFAFADVNGDGALDVLSALNTGACLSVLLNKGDGTFNTATLLQGPSTNCGGVAAVDMNADGVLDLVVSNTDIATISQIIGKGDGTFGAAFSATASARPLELSVGDFDKDGRPDIVVQNDTAGSFSVFRNVSE